MRKYGAKNAFLSSPFSPQPSTSSSLVWRKQVHKISVFRKLSRHLRNKYVQTFKAIENAFERINQLMKLKKKGLASPIVTVNSYIRHMSTYITAVTRLVNQKLMDNIYINAFQSRFFAHQSFHGSGWYKYRLNIRA